MKSTFVQQIEDAMRPLVGHVEHGLIHGHGLQAAYQTYERLMPFWKQSNGVPDPKVTPKFQACAEAFVEAAGNLGISHQEQAVKVK